jgi:hypothetical protein
MRNVFDRETRRSGVPVMQEGTMSLSGKPCVVTGGGHGLGLDIASSLLDAGARVVQNRAVPVTFAFHDWERCSRATSSRDEDYRLVRGLQANLESGARDHLLFGRNEPGLQHRHMSWASWNPAGTSSAVGR